MMNVQLAHYKQPTKIGLVCLVFILLFVQMPYCCAQYVEHLNRACVPIKTKSFANVQTNLPRALTQVLIKLTGNPAITTVPAVHAELTNAQRYLQSYAYINRKLNGAQKLYADIRFDQTALIALLQHLNQPVWRANRPLVLICLHVTNQATNYLLTAEDNSNITQTIMQVSHARGLPIILPLLDLMAQQPVTATLNNFNSQQLMLLGKHYQAPVVFAGQLQHMNNNVWRARWTLIFTDAPVAWQTQATSADAAVAQGINKLADLLANQLAVNQSTQLQSQVRLQIVDVNNLKDYARLLHRLKHKSVVTGVKVDDMNAEHVLLTLQVSGGVDSLRQALNTDKHFSVIAADLVADSKVADLYYHWHS